jgi:hypothetical protein
MKMELKMDEENTERTSSGFGAAFEQQSQLQSDGEVMSLTFCAIPATVDIAPIHYVDGFGQSRRGSLFPRRVEWVGTIEEMERPG